MKKRVLPYNTYREHRAPFLPYNIRLCLGFATEGGEYQLGKVV